MEPVKDIFIIIFLISATALCFYLIKYLKEITSSVKSIEKDINGLTEEIKPVINKLDKVGSNLENISSDIKQKSDEIISYTDEIIYKVKNFSLTKNLPDSKNPVGNLITNLTALVKGVSAFWTKLKS